MEQQEIFQPLQPHEMAGRLMNKKAIQDFIFAGNATFTIRNNLTGNRFTYKIREDKNQATKWWVSNLRGPDLYQSMGNIVGVNKSYYTPWEYKQKRDDAVREHHLTMKKIPYAKRTPFDIRAWEKSNLPLSIRSFMWFLSTYKSDKEFPEGIEIWHEGICGRCGKKLTVPESIETGFGPICLGLINREDRQDGLKL